MPDLIRHPVADRSERALDSLRGEFIEPRVKPGMTKLKYISGPEDRWRSSTRLQDAPKASIFYY